MNTDIFCGICKNLHASAFCSVYRCTVPNEAQEKNHECIDFIKATPIDVANRLAKTLRSGPDGKFLVALWDAIDFFQGGRFPSRIFTPQNKTQNYIFKSLQEK